MNKPRSLEEVFTMLQQVNSRLEKLEKLDINLHGRKLVNAGDAVNSQDYTTLKDINVLIDEAISSIVTNGVDTDSAVAGNLVLHKLKHLFKDQVHIYGPSTLHDLLIGNTTTVDRLRFYFDSAAHTGTIDCYNAAYVQLEINADPLKLSVAINGSVIVGGTTSTVGFFGATAAAKQTLNAYTTNSQSAAYTSTPAALAQAATLVDLNLLRVAVENLRVSYDDLRTKLKTTTLVA